MHAKYTFIYKNRLLTVKRTDFGGWYEDQVREESRGPVG
jgi:hypothetical protein